MVIFFLVLIFSRLQTPEERQKFKKLREDLATKNNYLFVKNRAAITKDFQVLPYLVHTKTLKR